jgi:hypothetical protein
MTNFRIVDNIREEIPLALRDSVDLTFTPDSSITVNNVEWKSFYDKIYYFSINFDMAIPLTDTSSQVIGTLSGFPSIPYQKLAPAVSDNSSYNVYLRISPAGQVIAVNQSGIDVLVNETFNSTITFVV